MIHPTILTKVLAFTQNSIIELLPELYGMLLAGELHQVEQRVAELSVEVHSTIMELLLPAAAEAFNRQHEPPKGAKSTVRPHRIRIATGREVEVLSPYYKTPPQDEDGSRRPLLDHWQTIDNFSPLLYDRVGFMAMLAPSYELAHQGVAKFGMEVCLSSVQKITDRLAERCEELGHENRKRPSNHILPMRSDGVTFTAESIRLSSCTTRPRPCVAISKPKRPVPLRYRPTARITI